MGHMDVVSIISDYFNILYILILVCSHLLGEDKPETSYTRVTGHMDVVFVSEYFKIIYIVILLCSHVLGEDRPETCYIRVMGHMDVVFVSDYSTSYIS